MEQKKSPPFKSTLSWSALYSMLREVRYLYRSRQRRLVSGTLVSIGNSPVAASLTRTLCVSQECFKWDCNSSAVFSWGCKTDSQNIWSSKQKVRSVLGAALQSVSPPFKSFYSQSSSYTCYLCCWWAGPYSFSSSMFEHRSWARFVVAHVLAGQLPIG